MAKDIDTTVNEQLGRGLRRSKRNPRDAIGLIISRGAVPYDGIIQAIDNMVALNTYMVGETFPYPQIFVFIEAIIVCTESAIYEWNGSALELKLSGLTAGTTWDAVDFHEYIVLTNGRQTVKRNVASKTYMVDTSLPFGTCICNYNGQAILGSPNVEATGGI